MSHQATFDFVSQSPEELGVKQGEILVVKSPAADGWVRCENLNGQQGFVPESYLTVRAPVVAPAPRRSAPRAPAPAAAAVPPAAAPAPVFTPPPPAVTFEAPPTRPLVRMPSSKAGTRGGGMGEVDKSSISFTETMGTWKERERRFLKGEAERLPIIKKREYYYWDKQGNRQGPLSEQEMKSKFANRDVSADTFIAPITTNQASEALPKLPVHAYFPDSAQVFATAPQAAVLSGTSSQTLWMYLDDQSEIQGPFSGSQMRDWFLDNYFNENTRVKLASNPNAPFTSLGLIFPGDGGKDSFLSEGVQPVVAPVPPAYSMPPAATTYYAAPPPPVAYSSYAPPPPAMGAAAAPAALYSYDDPFASPDKPSSSNSSSRLLMANSSAQSGRNLLKHAMSSSGSNPFEAPDFSLPPPGVYKEDDWGVSWDDEAAPPKALEATSASEATAEPVKDGGKDTRVLAPFDVLTTRYLSDHNQVYHFLTRALPKDLGTVRCKIKRSIEGMLHMNYNRYDLFLEKDDGTLGPIIMSAIKHKRMLGTDSYYEMQVGQVSTTHMGTVIGEIMLTSLGSQFLLHNNVKMHSGKARDLACIHYLSTGAEGGPRKMTVGIPGFLKNSEEEFVEWAHKGSIKKSNLVSSIESLNFKDIQPLVNKPPVWSDKRGAWTLNFHGRVTRASVKNFQLIRPEEPDHVVLQHGRVGQDSFTMDVAWPMSVMQALTVCVSSLHSKLGVE